MKKKRRQIWLFAFIGILIIGLGIYAYVEGWFPGQASAAASKRKKVKLIQPE